MDTKKEATEIKAEPEIYYDYVKPEIKMGPESEINVKPEMKAESSDPTMYEDINNNAMCDNFIQSWFGWHKGEGMELLK